MKALTDVPTRQLRAWLRRAREKGGAVGPFGTPQEYTIAQLSAELALRADREASKSLGRAARTKKRRAQVKAARSDYRGRKDR